jgi:putative effector of murein hydrolase LrgA (UPF0299 family)
MAASLACPLPTSYFAFAARVACLISSLLPLTVPAHLVLLLLLLLLLLLQGWCPG